MTTLRIRGLYAAALTSLFRQYASEWEIVQPEDEIRTRLATDWGMDSPDVTIDDQADPRGTRDTIRIVGPGQAVTRAVQILQHHCMDVITHHSSSQVGAIYMGLVGLVSRVRRRAVVYLGGQLAGLLPLSYEDRDLPLGSYMPVRIEALSSEGDSRPQLSTVLTVPGRYAVLTIAPTVRISKQITDPEVRERLQHLGTAQHTGDWGIIWRTAAQEAEEPALIEEIQRLAQEAGGLRASIAAATSVGYLYGGDVTTQVYMPGHAQAICDSLRADILPTLPGHHKYKAQGDVYSAIVDALEKELPADALRSRTATLSVLASIDAMRPPFQDTLRCGARSVDGTRTVMGEGERLTYDLNAGWVEVRQTMRNRDSYPADLRLNKQSGDYALTRFQEGSWSYVSRFYSREGKWKGLHAGLTTPVAIFADQIQVMQLGVNVYYSPAQSLEVVGLESLQALHQQGVIGAILLEKMTAESAALMQQLEQENHEA